MKAVLTRPVELKVSVMGCVEEDALGPHLRKLMFCWLRPHIDNEASDMIF